MEFVETGIAGASLIKPRLFGDDRGFFTRAFCAREFAEAGLPDDFVQANHSGSQARGTLRGLHYQVAPYEEAKLVRCVRGSVFDVVLDIRMGSSSYGEWYGAELSADNKEMLLVPQGCAHGYLTLEDDSEVYYQVSGYYEASAERGIRWDDPAFNIQWPITENLTLSDKDMQWDNFSA